MLCDNVLRWVCAATGRGATVERIALLDGATSSALHRLQLHMATGATLTLVLRRFTDAAWLRDEPDLARHEAASLDRAREAGVGAPELVAYDDGRSTGVPAVLMTHVPGRVELLPDDREAWLDGLAEALVRIHGVDPAGHLWRYFTYNDVSRLDVPEWSSDPALWARAIEIVQGVPPPAPLRFIHRDYHPTNVLWQDGRLSGVVDWVNACRGAAAIDVSHCRLNLAFMYGTNMADRFLRAYERLVGAGWTYHPYWDLITMIEFLPGPPHVYEGWPAFGLDGLTDRLMAERVDAYLASVLARGV